MLPKTISYICGAVSLVGLAVAGDAYRSTQPPCDARMSVDILDHKTDLGANQPLSLKVHIENSSTNRAFTTMLMLRTTPDAFAGLECRITSPSGRDVSPRESERILHGSAGMYTVLPGQSLDLNFPLSKISKLDEPGTYKITAIKELRFGTNAPPCRIVSNPLYVKVAAAKQRP